MRKAILAGININNKDTQFDIFIEETKNLCVACEIEIVETCTQKSNSLDSKMAFRKGKVEQLQKMVEELDIDLVVFHNNLSVSMIYRLSNALNIEVIDRTTLILDIFSKRAKTKEAIIQTQMARLKYELPKVYYLDYDFDKERGRGLGETKIELIKRKIENQINDLKRELKSIKTQKEEQSKKRKNSMIKSVALVGYTNAGKSSLMNEILKLNNKDDKLVLQKDMLFATLDTSIRNIEYKGYKFLLFDTVGFVSNLPHELVESFKSTLEVVKDADLLIHVIDGSDEYNNQQKEITQETLKNINANNIKSIEVYSKSDKIEVKDPNLRYISCKNKEGINELLDSIINILYPNENQIKILLPYNKISYLDKYKNYIKIILIENLENASIVILKGESKILEKFKEFEI